MARIVDFVLVDDDGPDQSTELDQRVPVATVARQSRRFDCQHGAHASLADCSQQAFETRSGDAAARATEIIVDNFDGGPAKLTSADWQGYIADGGSHDCASADRPSIGEYRHT